MRISHFFIERPIFASVLSILLVLLGTLSFLQLPVAQYPDVVPPTISVSASYPGASAETIAATVATPLEQEINGVDGMIYMHSQSSGDGRLSLTVTFAPGTDLDSAQVLVQNRVASAEPRLPEEVRRLGVTTRKRSPDQLMVTHMVSPDRSRDQTYLANFAYTQVRDVLMRLDGVGDVPILGAGEYAMRIWLDPDRLAELDMTAEDVAIALRSQNVQVAGGTLNQPPSDQPGGFQVSVQTQGRLTDAAEFENIIVKSTADGRVTRLRDVGRAELGSSSYTTRAYIDGDPAVAMPIYLKPGANALDTAEAVLTTLKEISQEFPQGVEYRVAYNPTEFVETSVKAVYQTIFEAIGLVVLVVVLFLQNWRAAIIPIIAIPISLIGTFSVMAAMGFSLNMLSLFGLVLAIGIVVDDAIVVVENIERNMAAGFSPREAAHRTMDEVGSALISIGLVLSAVFIPSAFVPGISGEFYRQFALTIAVSTLISVLVSLTLSPALGALFLRHRSERAEDYQFSRHPFRWFAHSFNQGFDALAERYGKWVSKLVRVTAVTLVAYVALLGLTGVEFKRLPGGFIPEMDTNYLLISIQLPPAAKLERTDVVVKEINSRLEQLDAINHIVAFSGWSALSGVNEPNTATMFTPLVDFDKRGSIDEVAAEIRAALASIDDANILVIQPPPVRGIGNGGFRLMLQDRNDRGLEVLQKAAQDLAAAANADPVIGAAWSSFSANAPQLYVDIDRTRAEMLQVPMDSVFGAMENYIGSGFINEFNFLNRSFRVYIQAEAEQRATADDIARLRVRSDNGAIVPLGSLAQFENTTGPYRVAHYNIYPAIALDGAAAPGASSGEAIAAMERLAAEHLPPGIGFEWTDLAYQEKQAGNTAVFLFVLAVVFVFLVLAAQYESWLLPLSVILIVPMCLLPALLGLDLRGVSNNILAQIGFIVLIGLASKNAILIVEFAKAEEDRGLDRFQAAIRAAQLRLRPIVMTSLAFILGIVPMMISGGAGHELRQALSTAVFSGMLGVTLFGLLFTPVFYVLCRRWARRPASAAQHMAGQTYEEPQQ